MTTAEYKKAFTENKLVEFEGKKYYACGMMSYRNEIGKVINSVCIREKGYNGAYWVSVESLKGCE